MQVSSTIPPPYKLPMYRLLPLESRLKLKLRRRALRSTFHLHLWAPISQPRAFHAPNPLSLINHIAYRVPIRLLCPAKVVQSDKPAMSRPHLLSSPVAGPRNEVAEERNGPHRDSLKIPPFHQQKSPKSLTAR